MKKFPAVLVFLLVLFSSVFCVRAVQAETISDEILDQAKTQADLFLELKNALGLEWLDEYNAYLQDPVANPTPTWETSVDSLINGGYLSASFPADFVITPAGSEVKISRIISNQTLKDAIKIYIPAAEIVGDTVSLLVQRPAQWVAYEAALNGKVDRDGSGDPDILPGASLDFASGSSINFLSNDGKLLGINSLVYKGEEADTRFVNAAGDNMTGQLTINGNKVWHAGNDGSGSGLDADLLDGKDSSFFTNAGNLSSGIVPVARLSGTYDINISGNAATATKLATARTISLTGNASGSASFDGSSNISINTNVSYSSNSDKLDGYHADSFIKKSGDTATGPIYFQGGLSAEAQTKDDITTRTPSGFWQTNTATTGEGWPQTTNTWYHLLSSTHSNTGNYYAMQFAGNFYNSNDIYYRSTAGSGTTPWNKMWHSGNDGSGSGLDADTLDGKHWTDIKNYVDASGPAEGGWTQIPIGSVVSSFASPGPSPYGLAFDGTYLWVSDASNNRIYKITKSGSVVSSFAWSTIWSPRGLAFDGTYLWVSGFDDFYRDRIYKITRSGSVVSFFVSPGPSPRGLAFDGTYLWVSDIDKGRIYKITRSGSVVSSFASPGPSPYGLAFDGTYLWVSDTSNNQIYKITKSGSVVSSFASPGRYPYELAFDGTYLWVLNASNDRIYKTLPEIAVWAK